MNRRWHALPVVVVLAIAAGESPAQEVAVCVAGDPTNCKSASEVEKEAAADAAKQRRYAEALPFDYRDLVHALLLDFLHSSGTPSVEHRYFVRVFGSDVDAALIARLHESGFDVLPGSAWRPPDSRHEDARHTSRIRVDVHDIEQVDGDTYTIGIGYYCGSLCAGDSTYTLRKDGDSWRVVDRQMQWIASTGDRRDATQSS